MRARRSSKTGRFVDLLPAALLAAALVLPAGAGPEAGPTPPLEERPGRETAIESLGEPVIPRTVWPYGRALVRRGIADLFHRWNETAFGVDEELVRHVCYFYKYYSVIDRTGTNEILQRSREFLPDIRSIFAEYRLPEELAFAIPFVESAFRNRARSDKKAVGMFQFLARTAKSYGLKVGGGTDERRDFRRSAEACAMYLSENRNIFASTVLSVGSFHHGTNKLIWVLRRLPMKENKRSFDAIFKNRELGKYSKEYIPKCLAAALMYRFLEDRGLSALPGMAAEKAHFDRFVHVRDLKETYDRLLPLNPDLLGAKTTYLYATTRGYTLLSGVAVPEDLPDVDVAMTVPEIPPVPSPPPITEAEVPRALESSEPAAISEMPPEPGPPRPPAETGTPPPSEAPPAGAEDEVATGPASEPTSVSPPETKAEAPAAVTVPELAGKAWEEAIRDRFPDREILMNESYNGVVSEIGVVFDQNLRAGEPWPAGEILILEVGRPPVPEDDLSAKEYARFIREYMSVLRNGGPAGNRSEQGKGEKK